MLVPAGRDEKRIRKAVPVELLLLGGSGRVTNAVTENVSSRGARVVTEYSCTPGKRLVLTALAEGIQSLARVVYCEPMESSRFAVGLELILRVEGWGKARKS